jgi:type IV pilus assembly protein PilO
MKQALLELFLQKTGWLAVIAVLLFLNILSIVLIEFYQRPGLDKKLGVRNELRQQVTFAGRKDAAADFRTSKDDLQKLQAMIPSKRQFPAIVGEIMEAASSCNVTMGAITYKPKTVKDQNLQVYEVTMSVTGRYGSVKSFLFDMQMLEGLIIVDGVSFVNEGPYVESITMETRLMVYLRDAA